MEATGQLSGAILAGGEGKRFGADKAGLVVDGVPVLHQLFRALAGLCAEVVVAVGKKRPLPLPAEAALVEDFFPRKGPLSGIHAALAATRGDTCLILACDMPFVARKLLWRLCQRAEAGKAVVFEVNGHIEPFPGIYPRTLLPALEKAIGRNELGVQRFLRRAPVLILPENEARALDPELLSFTNVNSAQDWTRLILLRPR